MMEIKDKDDDSSTSSDDDGDYDLLPNNVQTKDQIAALPMQYVSGDPNVPLQSVDRLGNVYKYALNPTTYSVIFILLVELIERFSFYGVNHTQTLFLTGAYNKQWSVNMSAVEASAYVSISTAVVYSSPFIGALLADCLIGDYWVILLGTCGFYIPGIALLAITTVPKLFGGVVFPKRLLKFSILVLWPFGAGVIKSVVNVFGARQFHPQLQSSMIESYYVNFYMCINVGALIGGIVIPVLAQHNVTIAYFIPVCVLPLGLILFLSATPRYVRRKPQGDIRTSLATLNALAISLCRAPCILYDETTIPTNKIAQDAFLAEKTSLVVPMASKGILGTDAKRKLATAKNARQLIHVLYISTLTIAFTVAYSQMATVFMIQGAIMKPAAGFIDAAIMHNVDAVSVLVCGFLVANYLYTPKRGKIYTTYKFAIGSFLGIMAVLCALIVEYRIHSVYKNSGEEISVLWQTFSYIFIGAGEIFTISTAYEVAFAISPKEQKALSSALNLFCIGALPNFVCILLYNLCKHWFTNSRGEANIDTIEDYTQANVSKYFWLLLLMNVIGMGVNLLPSIRDWVASIEEEAEAKVYGRDNDDSPLLQSAEQLKSPCNKTVLHSGKSKDLILLNRHASEYGSV